MKYETELDVEWTEDVKAPPLPDRILGELIGRRVMRGRVKLTVDLVKVARSLGRKALKNKGRKAKDGELSVVVVRDAVEVSSSHLRIAPNSTETF